MKLKNLLLQNLSVSKKKIRARFTSGKMLAFGGFSTRFEFGCLEEILFSFSFNDPMINAHR